MKLHWSSRSPYVRKVLVAAEETNTAARIETVLSIVSMQSANPEVLRDNPLGKIPTLITDDGQALYDSLVICESLDHIGNGTRLFPPAFDERLQALRWHALGSGLTDLLIVWFNERGRKPELQSSAHLQAYAAKCRSALDALEASVQALAQRPFDIGHIAVGAALAHADFRFGDIAWREGRPQLAAWFDGINQRESFRKTVQVDPAAK